MSDNRAENSLLKTTASAWDKITDKTGSIVYFEYCCPECASDNSEIFFCRSETSNAFKTDMICPVCGKSVEVSCFLDAKKRVELFKWADELASFTCVCSRCEKEFKKLEAEEAINEMFGEGVFDDWFDEKEPLCSECMAACIRYDKAKTEEIIKQLQEYMNK